MSENNYPQIVAKFLCLATLSLGMASVALATPALPAAPIVAASPGLGQAPAIPATFISTGSRFALDALGIAVTPPAGWEVITDRPGLSLVMQEPKSTVPDYTKPKYQRNITLAVIHHPSPIDATRAIEFQKDLQDSFGKDPMVSNFQVMEHRFFNYKGTNDGLLVYTSLKLGEFPMMQMHVLISGTDKQYVMTYTDLASDFNAATGSFDKAWNTMASAEVNGFAPKRYMAYVPYASAGAALCFVFGFVSLWRRRSARKTYANVADEIYSEQPLVNTSSISNIGKTISAVWSLKSNADAPMDAGANQAPITQPLSFVSAVSTFS